MPETPVKLNIGAGNVAIEGFTPIDRRLGTEAYPLPEYADDSVEEIRASHILEHFSFREAEQALREWVRVLKPGGRIRIAVPGVEKIFGLAGENGDSRWPFYLMGGQTDENDYHKSCWTEPGLRQLMQRAGLADIQPWTSSNTDCAALPVSLNLEGVKSAEALPTVKIRGVVSVPRYGSMAAWGQIFEALTPFRIPLHRFHGVFWGQCMQRAFNQAVADGIDWILTADYDSMVTREHIDTLLGEFGNNSHIDALAALQPRRGKDGPLMTIGGETSAEITGEPLKVTTAHFGLTLIRVDALKDVPKPWFWSKPDENGEWGEDRLDDDIWFWHQWRLAGKTIYVSPNVRIGHLDERIDTYNSDMEVSTQRVVDWREEFCGKKPL